MPYSTDDLLYALKVLDEGDVSAIAVMVRNPEGEQSKRLSGMLEMISSGMQDLVTRMGRYGAKPESALINGLVMVSTAAFLTAVSDDDDLAADFMDWLMALTTTPKTALWVGHLVLIAFSLGYSIGGGNDRTRD